MSGMPCGLGSVLFAGGDESALVGDRDEPGAVVAVEFAQDLADVALGGEWTDRGPVGDLVVVEAAGDQPQDLEVTLGKFGECRDGCPGSERAANSAISRRVIAGDRSALRGSDVLVEVE